jgi:hypothetical protein
MIHAIRQRRSTQKRVRDVSRADRRPRLENILNEMYSQIDDGFEDH